MAEPQEVVVKQASVDAEPTPEPTGAELERLRHQLEADVAKWKAAGNAEAEKASQERLDALAPADVATEEVAEEGSLEDLTKDELLALAEERGVETTTSMNKADIIAAIEEG
jgi:Rho termination factor, N-terminal domain